jgi:hypothetical protein
MGVVVVDWSLFGKKKSSHLFEVGIELAQQVLEDVFSVSKACRMYRKHRSRSNSGIVPSLHCLVYNVYFVDDTNRL